MDTRDCRVSEVLNPVPPQCRLSTHAVVGACLLCRATGTATACDDNVQSRTSVRAVPVQPCRLAAPGSLGLGEDSPAVLQTPCHAYRTLVIHSLLSSPLLSSPLLSSLLQRCGWWPLVARRRRRRDAFRLCGGSGRRLALTPSWWWGQGALVAP
jgi:hypothetical protein